MNILPRLCLLIVFICLSYSSFATTDRYRGIINDDPSSSFTIGWNQITGANPAVHFDVVDHGVNWQDYANTKAYDRNVAAKGMQNYFANLFGLQPNTVYYFVIKDSDSVSSRFSFKTAPDNPNERLSIIAGGDSRSNRTPRQSANLMVSKLRPHCVLFGGDMTNDDTDGQWQDWMDDWQLTTGTDGRIIPIIAARGNHENGNGVMSDLFDVPHPDVYYSITFGGNLLKTLTLNSLISSGGSQETWLENELQNSQNIIWKIAQYHFPIVPHATWKIDNLLQRSNWAPKFDTYDVQLVVECDAHVVKSTWPIRLGSSSEPGEDKGFVRDDNNGTVYVGEGTWGAPLRTDDDNHNWTRSHGSFNSFKWIFVDQQQIKVRTIKVDNAASVATVDDANIFIPPSNLDIWNPSTGAVICIENPNFTGGPSIQITNPIEGALIPSLQNITIQTNASDPNGSIDHVDFYINNVLLGTTNAAPFNFNWLPAAAGAYQITAIAHDNDGFTATSNVNIIVALSGSTVEVGVDESSDDAEETGLGILYLTSDDLELTEDGIVNGNQDVGIRFNNISVPAGATITNAYIQFTADGSTSGSSSLSVAVELSANPPTFSSSNDVSNRQLSTGISWSPLSWNAGENGTDQQTPNLNSQVQQIIDLSGWSTGNSMAFVIKGNGTRRAYAYDGNQTNVPVLHIEYDINLPVINAPQFSSTEMICGTEPLFLDAGAGYSQYFWNGDLSQNQGQFFMVDAPGTFSVTVMDQYGQLATSNMVTVTQVPEATVTITDTGNCGGCVELDAGSGYTNYSWSTGEATQLITVQQTGTYSVTVTDANGCIATDAFNADVTTGLDELMANPHFSVFPNPAENVLFIQSISTETVASVILYNVSGQMVLKEAATLGTKAKKLDVSKLESGIYFIELITDNERGVYRVLINR